MPAGTNLQEVGRPLEISVKKIFGGTTAHPAGAMHDGAGAINQAGQGPGIIKRAGYPLYRGGIKAGMTG
jgi:hypothetical protein